MAVLVSKKRERDTKGKKSTFRIRGKQISAEEIVRYAERKRVQDPTLKAVPLDTPTPTHITCLSLPSSPAAFAEEA